MTKKISFLLLCVFALCQCTEKKTVVDQQPLTFSGGNAVYKGTLPCADCAGIEATLTLKPDGSYVYARRYLQREGARFSSAGKYSIDRDILSLEEDSGLVSFSVAEDTLTLLGSDKRPSDGELAPYYRLKRERTFHYAGSYKAYSEKADSCAQTLTIVPEGEDYHVEFSISKGSGQERQLFSGTARLADNRLYFDIGDDTQTKTPMYIAPSHDNLGVEVGSQKPGEGGQMRPACDGLSLTGEYLKNTIAAGRLGVFTSTTTIAEVLQALPLAQIEKKVGRGEFKDDLYDDYQIYTRDNRHLLTLTPKETGSVQQKIDRVLVKSPFFATAKGIHCGSTYHDIKKAYTITRVEPTREHIVLVVDEIQASFTIPKTVLRKGWWNARTKTVDQSKIPDDAQVESFILWWNRSSVQ